MDLDGGSSLPLSFLIGKQGLAGLHQAATDALKNVTVST